MSNISDVSTEDRSRLQALEQRIIRLSWVMTIVNLLAILIYGAIFLTHNIPNSNVYAIWLLTFVILLSGGSRIYISEYFVKKQPSFTKDLRLCALLIWLIWFSWATFNLLTSVVTISIS